MQYSDTEGPHWARIYLKTNRLGKLEVRFSTHLSNLEKISKEETEKSVEDIKKMVKQITDSF